MKIRSGFVSNSSSSSFLIMGVHVGDFSNIDAIEFEPGETYIMVGKDLSEGRDIIRFFPDDTGHDPLLDWFKENQWRIARRKEIMSPGAIFKVFDSVEDNWLVPLPEFTDKLPEHCMFAYYEKDHYCTDSVERAKDIYLGEEE